MFSTKKAILLSFIRTQFYTGAESPQILQYRHAFLSTYFIPTRRPSTSAILASPKDQAVYLKLAFQSYLSSLV